MDDSDDTLDPVQQIADEFLERRQRGETPSLDEFAARIPDRAEEIREVLQAVSMLAQAGPPAREEPVEAMQTVADYRVIREIGRGGMGIVYEAVQQALGRRVALKVLPSLGPPDGNAMERFRREARAAARLHHTNIVPVFDVGESDGLSYYAMQYIAGQSLDRVEEDVRRKRDSSAGSEHPRLFQRTQNAAQVDTLADPKSNDGQNQPIETSRDDASGHSSGSLGHIDPIAGRNRESYYHDVAYVGWQVAQALDYAHARGVIHRDIKPSNLLMDSNGVVWITDFGLAKTQEDGLTRTGDVLGTLRYMSPERFSGINDESSDIYGLGVTLYELLAHRPAFDEADRLLLIDDIKRVDPPNLRSIDERVPRDLETIVLKSIHKEPHGRYASAADLAEDLRRFLADEPIRGRRTTSLERLARWARRNKALAATLSAIAALLIVGAVAGWIVADRQSRLRLDAENARGEADSQRERAERNLEKALQAVEVMLTQVSDQQLAVVPQMEALRRELLVEASRFHQEFLDDNRDNARAQFMAVRAQLKLANLHELLGDFDEADALLTDAMSTLDKLKDSLPEADWLAIYGQAARQQVAVLNNTGRADEGEQLARSALDVLPVIDWNDVNADIAKSRATLHGHLATITVSENRIEESLRESTEAIAIYQNLDSQQSLAAKDRAEFARLVARRGKTYADTGQFEDAMADFRGAEDILLALTESDTVPFYRWQLADSLRALGQQLSRQGKIDEAMLPMERAVDTFEQLVEEFPLIPTYADSLSNGYNNLAVNHAKSRRLSEAEKYFGLAADVIDQLCRRYPENLNYSRDLGYAYSNLSKLNQDLSRLHGDPERKQKEADYARRALDVRRNLAEKSENPNLQLELVMSMTAYAPFVRDDEGVDQAIEMLRDATETGETLIAKHPEVQMIRHKVAISHRNVGMLLSESRSPEAESHLVRAAELFQQIADETPTSVDPQHELAAAQHAIGLHSIQMGHHGKAVEQIERAIETLHQLVAQIDQRVSEDAEDLPKFQFDLGRLYMLLADPSAASREFADAATSYAEMSDASANSSTYLFDRVENRVLSIQAGLVSGAYSDDQLSNWLEEARQLDELVRATSTTDTTSDLTLAVALLSDVQARLFAAIGEPEKSADAGQSAAALFTDLLVEKEEADVAYHYASRLLHRAEQSTSAGNSADELESLRKCAEQLDIAWQTPIGQRLSGDLVARLAVNAASLAMRQGDDQLARHLLEELAASSFGTTKDLLRAAELLVTPTQASSGDEPEPLDETTLDLGRSLVARAWSYGAEAQQQIRGNPLLQPLLPSR